MPVEVEVLKTRSKEAVAKLVTALSEHKQKVKGQLNIVYKHDDSLLFKIEVKRNMADVATRFKEQGYKTALEHMLGLKYTIQAIRPVSNEEAKVTKREFLQQVGDIIDNKISLISPKYAFTKDGVNIIISEIDETSFVVTADDAKAIQMINDLNKSNSKKSKTKSSTLSVHSSSKSKSKEAEASSEWMLPNRVGFNKWMYHTFHPSKYANPAQNADQSNKRTLFPHQRLVKDFMEYQSPFRGLLMYHGLGVGKTCASIAAAEGFLQRHKRVFVLVPASLAQNYKNEIAYCATMGNPSAKIWNIASVPDNKAHPAVKRIMEVYNISYDLIKKHHAKLWLPELVDGVPFSRRNLSWNSLSEIDKQDLSRFLNDFIESKYTFISYNGATRNMLDALGNDPFSDSFIVMDEAHNFISRVVNGGSISSKLFEMIMNAKRSKMIFLSGTPVINHPFELCVLLNLVRGQTRLHKFKFTKDADIPSKGEVEALLYQNGLLKYVDILDVSTKERNMVVQFLPANFVRSDAMPYVKNEKWNLDEDGVRAQVMAVLAGKYKLAKRVEEDEVFALPVEKSQFEKMFLDDTNPEKLTVKNQDVFMRRILGLVSYFKTAGEEYFPTVLPRVIERVPMTPYQFSQYVEVRNIERSMEESKKRNRARGGDNLFSNKGTVYRAFSRMACNFVFPEYIKRDFPANLRNALKKEIASVDEEDDDSPQEQVRDVNKEAQKMYETSLVAALKQLKESPQQPLSNDKLRDMYSPKFAKILRDIATSPGTCLLYSQFRRVEGLGILRLVLEHAGFVEVSVEKRDAEWTIVNKDRVLDSIYDGKRFIVFNEDREKTDILIKIFNGAMADLPPLIARQLADSNFSDNLRGELVRAIMISQSGAEGISLKNVRRVLIAEPFWNKVRIDQVIGRAVRTGSHLALPPEDRNVQVFMYTSCFTEQQLRDNFTLQRLDHSITSDQHIFNIAEQKSQIIQHFLDMLKQASIDCLNNATKNGMLESGMQCYAFPINMSDDVSAFSPYIQHDIEHKSSRHERARKIRGRVVAINGKRFVEVEGLPGYYDYHAYKDGGVLVAANL